MSKIRNERVDKAIAEALARPETELELSTIRRKVEDEFKDNIRTITNLALLNVTSSAESAVNRAVQTSVTPACQQTISSLIKNHHEIQRIVNKVKQNLDKELQDRVHDVLAQIINETEIKRVIQKSVEESVRWDLYMAWGFAGIATCIAGIALYRTVAM